ncbi:MAG: tRNA epoxyqueuosine(34) reductase QueG [Armatimonadota bacterium]
MPDPTNPTAAEGAKEALRRRAHGLGFDQLRFTGVDSPDHAATVRAWLAAGMHGEMGWLASRDDLRSGRLDDPRLLAGARTVLVGAVSYDHPEPARGAGANGTVARYARGADYHTVLWGKLDQLAEAVAVAFPGARCRGFTDSGPIRERELARRAGIGWQGKHTNLISLDLGNFFFLCALLTTADIAPDPPFESHHCGSCVRCIEACPTAAIVAPMTLDARRCISYWTIEAKGSIPHEMRIAMGDRIFGCDDCLAVCPWNHRAARAREARFAPADPDRAFPDLRGLLELLADDAEFRRRFAGTPLLRPGRAGLRRNTCVALGNTGSPADLPSLEIVGASDPSEMVREHALWAMERIRERLGSAPDEGANASPQPP